MTPIRFARIIIESDVSATTVAQAVRRNAAGAEIVEEPAEGLDDRLRHLALAEGKRVLLVRRFRGRSVKQCQGFKPEYTCCNLQTLTEGNHCALDCSYCILQYYMTSPFLSAYANTDDLQAELSRHVAARPDRIFRVTTGELADSLLLDPMTETSRAWVPYFRGLPNAVLELKTKTASISNLLDLDGGERTVVSWSVNPPEVIEREELKTATLEERLQAASAVCRRGYPVGFHLDPIVQYPAWRDGYPRLIDALLDAVPPRRIAWISLGSLRFPPEMKPTLVSRFPGSGLRHGEMVHCADGKLRYLRPLRLEMFRTIVGRLRARLRGEPSPPLVYLCMEPAENWRRVFGEPGPTPGDLDSRFARSYQARFPAAMLAAPWREAYDA